MMKRVFALILCLVLLTGALAGCKSKSTDDKGAYIAMYLSDEIYDFDPANAYYNNDLTAILELLYEPLFTLSAKGKIQNALAQSYVMKTDDDGIHMEITLKETVWSNNYALTANDCLFAWQRLLDPNNGFAAASLLFDIKNARAYNQGLLTKDDLMVEAVEQRVIRITFENNVDINAFLLNLTNVATAPLLSVAVKHNADWAKKASTLVTSGPFKVAKLKYEIQLDESGKKIKAQDDYSLDVKGNQRVNPTTGEILNNSYNVMKVKTFILERNQYYYRDVERDALDKYVLPYRIVVDCSMSAEELLEEYKQERLFYVGAIPLSLRNDEYVRKNVTVSDSLSTFVCYLNENAEINGQKLFADQHVRLALSLALDRQEIADGVVYAKPATALVGPKVFEKGTSGSFRSTGGDLISVSANLDEARAELAKVEIEGFAAGDYPFTIKVASYDEAQIQMANQMKTAWEQLGFPVTVEIAETIVNNDERSESDQVSTPEDVCDDLFVEAIQRGKYEAIVFDYASYAPTAYATLSSFALTFSGSATMDETNEYSPNTHNTGYNSTAYNNLMEAVYFIPYFSAMAEDPAERIFDDPDTNPYMGIGLETKEDYVALYNAVKAIYEEYGIQPTDKSAKWEEQKAILLHAAEKLLMQEMPVIPIVFNQNASMTNKKHLSGITSTYYTPSYFKKVSLKNYEKYTYVFYKFPTVSWENFGLTEEPK